MSTRPDRPKATKLYSDFKPERPTIQTTNGNVVDRVSVKNTTELKRQSKQSDTSKQNNANKPQSYEKVTENKETTQPKNDGLPKGFVSLKDMIARTNAKKSEPKPEYDTSVAEKVTKNKETTTQPKNSGRPKGFVSLKDMIARTNAKKSEPKPEYDTSSAALPAKHITSLGIPLNRSENKTLQENGKPRRKVTEQTPRKGGDHYTQHTDKSSKDKLNDQHQPVKKSSQITLEKGRTYRVPTRDATDSIVHTKPDLNAFATVQGAKPKAVTRNHAITDRRDIKATRRQTVNDSARTEPRIPSAKSSHSRRTTVSQVVTKKEQLPSNALKIMIMNASGKNDKSGAPADRRKNVIQTVIIKESPHVLLFQEFRWVGITGKTWENYPIPEHFTYKGHTEASILYDRNIIEVQDLPATEIDTLLGGLQNNANNRLKQRFPLDFTPVPRMCITQVTSSKSSAINFIIISWHGRHNASGGGRMKEATKIEYFEYLMEFLRQLKEKYKLPLVIAGDFNVDMHSIEKCVQPPFKLGMYDASMRRTVNGIVDFFIVTEEIEINTIKWFDIERDTRVFHPTEVLDHDPVSAVVRFAPAAKGKTKFNNDNAWVSPKTKAK